jgi:hypothetical protein
VIAFARLCDAMERAGVEVRVPLGEDGRHLIRLVDSGAGAGARGARSLTVPVVHGFDATATMLCCSLALARDVPGVVGEAPALAAAWPELVDLGRAGAEVARIDQGAA